MPTVERVQIEAYGNGYVKLQPGDVLRVISIGDAQIVDSWTLGLDDPTEYLCTANTRTRAQKLFPKVGDKFMSQRGRPMLTFLKDTSPGVHDMLYPSCSEAYYASLGYENHASCAGNFLKVCKELGLDAHDKYSDCLDPVDWFQNTPADGNGDMSSKQSPVKAGQYVELRAEMPVIFIAAACSWDLPSEINPNGGVITPVLLEVERAT